MSRESFARGREPSARGREPSGMYPPRHPVRPVTWLIVLGFFLFPAPIARASGIVEGALGQWLRTDAIPQLTGLISKHPRLKDMPVRIMAMKNGIPVPVVDGLTAEIREQLRYGLLNHPGISVQTEATLNCVRRNTDNVLGIDIQRQGPDHYRVSLAIVDVNEGIWINGSSTFWHGKLGRAQKQALHERIDNTLTTSQPRAIAMALLQQTRCQSRLRSPVYFPAPSGIAMERVAKQVWQHLREVLATGRNHFVLTPVQESASTWIALDVQAETGSRGIFTLELTDPDDGLNRYSIASISAVSASSPTIEPAGTTSAERPASPLLSGITIRTRRDSESRCAPGKRDCVDIGFRLYRSAYLVTFYTHHGEARLTSCDLPVKDRPGMQYRGLNVPSAGPSSGPALGFYVLAFTDRASARTAFQSLRDLTGSCGTTPPADEWWTLFQAELAQMGRSLNWQAIHLTRENNRIRPMKEQGI